MPDISMCKNEDCKAKESCYRYMAKPNPHWQSYLVKQGKMDKCDHFWEIEKKKAK